MCFRTYLEQVEDTVNTSNCQEITKVIKGTDRTARYNKIYEVAKPWSMILQQCMNRIAQLRVSMMWLCYNLNPEKMKRGFRRKF
jgi:uncharacterized protein YfcZ (UPF0381/DUF406 family)